MAPKRTKERPKKSNDNAVSELMFEIDDKSTKVDVKATADMDNSEKPTTGSRSRMRFLSRSLSSGRRNNKRGGLSRFAPWSGRRNNNKGTRERLLPQNLRSTTTANEKCQYSIAFQLSH